MKLKNYLFDMAFYNGLGETEIRIVGVSENVTDLLKDIKKVKGHGHIKWVAETMKIPRRTFNGLLCGSSPIQISQIIKLLKIWQNVCGRNKKELNKKYKAFFLNSQSFTIEKGKKVSLPKNISKELAYLLGFLFGDGCLTDFRKARVNRNRSMYPIQIAVNTKQCADEILFLFKKVFDLNGKIYDLNCNCKEFFIHSKVLYIFLNKICEMPIGKKKGKLRVPKIIKDSPIEFKSNFIAGFFDADGFLSVKRRSIVIDQADDRILMEIADLLDEMGIKTRRIYICKKELGTTYSLTVSWSSTKDFINKAPFLDSTKIRKANEILSNLALIGK